MQPPEYEDRRNWPLFGIAAAFFAVLMAFSGRYGYHRDEFYFIAIGKHPAFGYDDQPPLVPLLAHAMDAVSGGSLVVLRLPSALAGAVIVLFAGLLAREFGGGRGAQVLASGVMAVAAVLIGISHLMSTTTYDVLAWTVLSWAVVRALREGGRWWLLVGVVAGIGLEIKTLMLFLLFALLVGVVAVGPRSALRDRWLWVGALVALAIFVPNLVWQASHDWPQLQLSKAIANGDSGSSQPRATIVPMLLLLVSPLLFPIWIAGLWKLWKSQLWRAISVAWVLLVVIFVITGGKSYYLTGLFPVLVGAGAEPTLTWAGQAVWRAALLRTVLALSLIVDSLLFLPIVPADDLDSTPILAINYDAGEQVGWPAFVREVRGVYDDLPAAQRDHAVILGINYGEDGAILHSDDPPPTYSPQNSMWDLGPPPSSTTTVVAVNYYGYELRRWFTSVRLATRIDNGVGLDNDEQGAPVYVASGLREPWPRLWDELKTLG